jgi:type IV pilus assembly protein PilE
MKNMKGFTMIELMMVIAIIGVISALAMSSYKNSVIKTKRSDAKATLMDWSAQMERCYTANGTYLNVAAAPPNPAKTCDVLNAANTALNPGAAGPPAIPNYTVSVKGYYTITLGVAPNPPLTATTFSFTATPIPAQLVDPECTSFTITNTGAKTATGTIGTVDANGARCW